MRFLGAILAAGVLLSGCSAATTGLDTIPLSQLQTSLPVATRPGIATAAVTHAKSGTAATLAPSAAKVSATSTAAASQPERTATFVPKNAADMQQALQVLTSGLQTTDGKPFNLFNTANPPANAVVTSDPSLATAASQQSGYSVQSTADDTQSQADQEAYAWASDAKQVWVGWGYWGRWAPLSIFGQARHVYYSESKQRLLYLDYNFFKMEKSRWVSDNIVMRFAGKYITDVLDDARGRFPYTGWMAFNQARQFGYGYDARTSSDIKAICIDPIFIGPKWIFFDSINKPAMIVDASSGEVTNSGWLFDVVRSLSFFSP